MKSPVGEAIALALVMTTDSPDGICPRTATNIANGDCIDDKTDADNDYARRDAHSIGPHDKVLGANCISEDISCFYCFYCERRLICGS